VDWKDSVQFQESIQARFSKSQLTKLRDLYDCHCLLWASHSKDGFVAHDDYRTALPISTYGTEALSKVGNACSENGPSELAVAALTIFCFRDLLIDLDKADLHLLISRLDIDLREKNLRLPHRFGRLLYDRFNDNPAYGRPNHLEATEVEALIGGTDQGVYQVGRYISGPFGILESNDQRFIPPSRSLPLWHCDDPGCGQIHDVSLRNYRGGFFACGELLADALRKSEGPPSEWEGLLARMHRDLSDSGRSTKGRDFFDIACLIADALSPSESETLFAAALGGPDSILQDTISSTNDCGVSYSSFAKRSSNSAQL
jgi:hypothetical protein